MEQDVLNKIVARVIAKTTAYSLAMLHPQPLPVGVSNRHVHLSSADLEVLFGKGYKLRKVKDLSQTGQFASGEAINIAGPKGCIENVRILGPVRKQTQVEVSRSDAYKLGVNPPVRESGDLAGTPGITVIGPKGSVVLTEGVIIAKRHIHMTPSDAEVFGVKDGEIVHVKTAGDRSLVFDQVVVRVNDNFVLDYHVDTDEANSAGLSQGDFVYLVTYNTSIGLESLPASGSPAANKTTGEPVSLVTEAEVFKAWNSKSPLYMKKGGLITPLAKDVIKELGVEVITC